MGPRIGHNLRLYSTSAGPLTRMEPRPRTLTDWLPTSTGLRFTTMNKE